MKKIIILLIVLIITTAVMAYLYFARINERDRENDGALNVATYHAAMVFQFNSDKNFNQLMSEQSLFDNFLGVEKSLELKQLKDYFTADQELYKLSEGKKVYCSIVQGDPGINLLITAQLADAKQQSDLIAILKKTGTTRQVSENLFSLKLNDSLNVFAGINKGLILISSSEKIIKERLAENTHADKDFENYVKAAVKFNKNSLMSLFINFNNFTPLLKDMVAGNIDGELAKLNEQNSFAELNYNFSKEKILFHGTTVVNDNKNYYQLFSNLEPQAFSVNNILPSKTANYNAFAINDYKEWLKMLDQYLLNVNKTKKTTAVLDKVKKSYLIDLRKSFSQYFGGQFITFQLNTGEKLGAIALNNGTKVKQLFIDMSTLYDGDISIFKDNDILYSLFGDVFSRFNRPFYVVKGNYLIFANNASTIQSFVRSYDNNELLVNEQFYIDFRNQFPESGNVSFYVNLRSSKDVFRQNLHLGYYKHFLASSGLGDYDSFCYQLNGDKGKFQTNMVIAKNSTVIGDSVLISK